MHVVTAVLATAFFFSATAVADSLTETTREPDPGQIRFISNISPVGNLFYQMECLGGQTRCSQSAFRALWEELGGLDEDNQQAIAAFSNVLSVYGFRAQLGPRAGTSVESSGPFGSEIVDIGPPPTQGFSLLHRMRLAAYGSGTPEELFDRIGLFMHPDDTAVVVKAVRRFWPRFESWWNSGASESLIRFESALDTLLQTQNESTLPAIAAFYDIRLPDDGLYLTVHLIAHPSPRSSTRAEVIENQAVVEVLAGESPETRLGVIVHELTHYLFAIAPKALHDVRLSGALRSSSPRSAAALGLMNEALATAIGNGFVEEQIRGEDFNEYFERERSFYAQVDVDLAAKAIYPLVKEYLSSVRTLDDEFTDRYYDLVSKAVGEGLDSLASRLRVSAYVATDEELALAMRRVPRLLGMNSLYGSTVARGQRPSDSVLHRHSYLNGVILLRNDERQKAAELLPEANGKIDGFISTDVQACVYTRESESSVYFVVVDSSPVSEEALIEYMQSAVGCESAANFTHRISR